MAEARSDSRPGIGDPFLGQRIASLVSLLEHEVGLRLYKIRFIGLSHHGTLCNCLTADQATFDFHRRHSNPADFRQVVRPARMPEVTVLIPKVSVSSKEPLAEEGLPTAMLIFTLSPLQ